MPKGKKRIALGKVERAVSEKTGAEKTKRTRAEKQAATLSSLLSVKAVVLLSDSEGEKENVERVNNVPSKNGPQYEKKEGSVDLSDDEEIVSIVVGNASDPETCNTVHCADDENIEKIPPVDTDTNVGTEGRLEGEVIQMRDEQACPQSSPGALLDAAMRLDTAVDAVDAVGEGSRTDPCIESSVPGLNSCTQAKVSSHEEEGATAGNSEVAVAEAVAEVVAEPLVIAKAEPKSTDIAQKSELAHTQIESNIKSDRVDKMDMDEEDDEDDDDELEPLYAYRPPTMPQPTFLVLDDDDSCDLPDQPSIGQSAKKSAPGEKVLERKYVEGKPERKAATTEERWSLDDVLGSPDVPSKAAMSQGELFVNVNTKLTEFRQMQAEKTRMEEETKLEMELERIEEAASRATMAKHMKALEASKANVAAMRQNGGATKGGACDSARDGGAGGLQEGREDEGARDGSGEGDGEEEERVAVATVTLKIRIREASGEMVQKMYSMKTAEPFAKLFNAFAKSRGHLPNQYRFTFEDPIDPNSTPASLDMEDDDMVEATFWQ